MANFGVTFESPEWCKAGLDDSTDFANTTEDSPSGYASGGIRKYSRQACENLGSKNNIWSANGECVPVLAPDGKRYNASLVCAGLNDNTVNDYAIQLSEFDYDCPINEDKNPTGWIILSAILGIALGSLIRKS